MNCTFNPSDSLHFPFQFRDVSGKILPQGVSQSVVGFVEPVCIFATDACLKGVGTEGGTSNPDYACCEVTQQLYKAHLVAYYPLVAFFIPYSIFFVINIYRRITGKKSYAAQAMQAYGSQPCWKKVVFAVVFSGSVAALVAQSVIMPVSIQRTLSPVDRAAQLSMSSFLQPIEEVFAFLEDAMVVKVGYAMASNRFDELNALLHVSVIGGAVCALIAFLLMVIISSIDALAVPILNPSATTNKALIDAGCSLVPTSDQLLANARIYWLLISAAWFPSFITKGLYGFMIGTGQVVAYLGPLIVTALVPLALWFGLLGGNTGLPVLGILGIAYGTASWIVGIALVLYLLCSKSLKQRYQLQLMGCGKNMWQNWKKIFAEVAREGLQLMIVDLTIQLSLTITIYVAASRSFEEVYKLSAVQSAYWVFGPAYLMGFALFLKLMGAQMLARRQFRNYVYLFGFAIFLTLSLAVAAVIAAETKRLPVAYYYGETACVFATQPQCAPVYANIFQGRDEMANVFQAFGVTVGLQLFFLLLRAGLSTCYDFLFMAKASVIAFVFVYIPFICIARYAIERTIGYYVAMYLPHFVLTLVFGVRMAMHLRKLWRNEEGPWSVHAQQAEVLKESDNVEDPQKPNDTFGTSEKLGSGIGNQGQAEVQQLIPMSPRSPRSDVEHPQARADPQVALQVPPTAPQ